MIDAEGSKRISMLLAALPKVKKRAAAKGKPMGKKKNKKQFFTRTKQIQWIESDVDGLKKADLSAELRQIEIY
jgi:hypothetical protein